MRNSRIRAGAGLLEVVAAVLILSIAGVTAVVMVTEAARSVERARAADAEMRAASAFLDAVALWTPEDLDRRLGVRRQGPWRLYLERPLPALYTVVLADTAGGRVLLRTSLFRPEEDRVDDDDR